MHNTLYVTIPVVHPWVRATSTVPGVGLQFRARSRERPLPNPGWGAAPASFGSATSARRKRLIFTPRDKRAIINRVLDARAPAPRMFVNYGASGGI